LKNRIANIIEKIVSPFAKSEVSDAVVCLRPKKNMAGAIAAPIIEVVITRIYKELLFACCLLEDEEKEEASVCNDDKEEDGDDDLFRLNNTITLKNIADTKYTKDESKNGFTVYNTGFAIVDTEPKRAAAINAPAKPMPIDFVILLLLSSIIRNTTQRL
jgi:hypothetical protein